MSAPTSKKRRRTSSESTPFSAKLSSDRLVVGGSSTLGGTLRQETFEPEDVSKLRDFYIISDPETNEGVRVPGKVLASALGHFAVVALQFGIDGQFDTKRILQGCPLEEPAKVLLIPLLRALVANQFEGMVVVSRAIFTLALAHWLGLRGTHMESLLAAMSSAAHLLPEMFAAIDPSGPSATTALSQGLLVTSATCIEALAGHNRRDFFRGLCGQAVLDCLSRLATRDPHALQLCSAAAAAVRLGLTQREVNAFLPDTLRFGEGVAGAKLTLSLRGRHLGPEAAARLELPTGLDLPRELNIDFSKCALCAVGAASLKLPEGLQRLRLVLRKCGIGPEGAKALRLPKTLTHLELNLSHCSIGPDGAAGLSLPPSLEELDLCLVKCGLGDRGVKALSLPVDLRRLRLNLSQCAFGIEGAGALVFPGHLTHLDLDLTLCGLDSSALRPLLKCLPSTIQCLQLRGAAGFSARELKMTEALVRSRLSHVERFEMCAV